MALSTRLLYSRVQTLRKEECDTSYRIDRNPFPVSQICAIATEGQLLLDGDHGGALILEDSESPEIIGIFSYTSKPSTQRPGQIYTRVSSYINWIETTTNILFV